MDRAISDALIEFVFDVVPPLYAAFSRVLDRCEISEAEFFGLFLLNISPVEIKGRKAWPANELRDSITRAMVYAKQAAASGILSKMKQQGYVQVASLDYDWDQYFPPTSGQKNAVFLEQIGAEKYRKVKAEAQSTAAGFLMAQDDETVRDLFKIFVTASNHPALPRSLAEWFLHPPKKTVQEEKGMPPKNTGQLPA